MIGLRRTAGGFALIALAACGLDVLGTAVSATVDPPMDAGEALDPAPALEASVPVDAPVLDADAVDATVPPAPCEGDASIVAFGRCYLRVPPHSHPVARAICEDAGAHLVTIRSEAENAHVADAGAGVDQWIGYAGPPGVSGAAAYRWLSGDPATFTKWSPGDPNGAHGCARMFASAPNAWGDLACTSAVAALCERDR